MSYSMLLEMFFPSRLASGKNKCAIRWGGAANSDVWDCPSMSQTCRFNISTHMLLLNYHYTGKPYDTLIQSSHTFILHWQASWSLVDRGTVDTSSLWQRWKTKRSARSTAEPQHLHGTWTGILDDGDFLLMTVGAVSQESNIGATRIDVTYRASGTLPTVSTLLA